MILPNNDSVLPFRPLAELCGNNSTMDGSVIAAKGKK
jgi:hypothetical protein